MLILILILLIIKKKFLQCFFLYYFLDLLSNNIEFLLNFHTSGFILSSKIRRGKQPPQVPELSQFQKELIFGCKLGDVSA